MDIKNLITFFWVAELGGITAAAEKLSMTQPAVSQRIRNFEHSLGIPLFVRRKKRLILTSRGQDLLAHARQIVNIVDQIQVDLGFPRREMRLIRLGATDVVCLLWLDRFIAKLSAKHPELTWEIFTDLTINLRQLLLDGKLDFAILAGPVPHPHFVNTQLGRIDLSWVASSKLVNTRGPALGPKELAAKPMLSHTIGSDLYCMMEEWFAEEGVETPRFHRCSSLTTMISLSASGLGATLLPPSLLRRQALYHALRPLKVTKPLPKLSFYIAHPRSLFAPLAETVVQHASAQARRHFAPPQ